MTTNKKTTFSPKLSRIGALLLSLLGLLVLLDLMGADSDEDDVSTASKLGYEGSIPNSSTLTPPSTFQDKGNFFVVFENGGNVYLNYHKTGAGWLNTSIPLNLETTYGVTAVTLQNPNNKDETSVCLFLKQGGNNKETEGLIHYSCSPINYQALDQTPLFSWHEPILFDLGAQNNIDSTVSIFQSSASGFHLILGEDSGLGGGTGSEKSTYVLKHLSCSVEAKDAFTDPNLLNNICQTVTGSNLTNKQYRAPSIIALPDESTSPSPKPRMFYAFFRNAIDDENKISYLQLAGFNIKKTPIPLIDTHEKYHTTKKRPAVYYSKQYIYVAYKHKNDTIISFAKTSLDNWLNDLAFGKWDDCALKKHNEATGQTEYFVFSEEAPILFEENQLLYILYSDSKKNNTLTYKRIDNHTPTSVTCNG